MTRSVYLRATLESVIQHLREPLRRLLKQGVAEGVMNVSHPDLMAELYLRLGYAFKPMITRPLVENPDVPRQEVQRRLAFCESVLERILGLRQGSVEMVEPVLAYLDQMLAGVAGLEET